MNCGIVGESWFMFANIEVKWKWFSLSQRLQKKNRVASFETETENRYPNLLLEHKAYYCPALSLGSQPTPRTAWVNTKVWVEGEQRGSNQRSPSHSFDHSPNSCFHRPLLLIHSWQSGSGENRHILVSKAAVAKAGHLVQMPLCRVRCWCQLNGKDGESWRRWRTVFQEHGSAEEKEKHVIQLEKRRETPNNHNVIKDRK